MNNKLRNDELFLLAIDLSLPDLLNFCSVNKHLNTSICNNENFWLQKLNKDFPDWKSKVGITKSILGISYQSFIKDPKTQRSFNSMASYKEKYIMFHNIENFNILKEKLKIPLDIADIFKIKDLKISLDRTITEIPKQIGILTNLQVLRIYGTNVSSIPKEIGNLTNLQMLHLARNKISEIPKELFNLYNLRRLFLDWNRIKEIPKDIEKLTKLETLYIGENEIFALPKEIGKLTKLKDLDLEDNPIIELPKEIGNLINLRRLNLIGTNVSILPEELMDLKLKFPQLRILM